MFKFLRRIICQDVSAYSFGSWWTGDTGTGVRGYEHQTLSIKLKIPPPASEIGSIHHPIFDCVVWRWGESTSPMSQYLR
jgi:hypothetical protein